jgi:hypothetical protein
MERSLTILGVIASMLMMSGATASLASAEESFEVDTTHAILTGEQLNSHDNYFLINKHKIECNKASFVGIVASKTFTDVTVHPKFGECKQEGLEVVIRTKYCDFTLKTETNIDGTFATTIICEAGKVMEIEIPSIKCKLTLSPQTPTGGYVYTNTAGIEGSPDEIDATAALGFISYTRDIIEGTGTACKEAFPASGTDGEFVNKATFRAYEEKELIGSLTQETLAVVEGVQVDVSFDPGPVPALVVTGEQLNSHEHYFLIHNHKIECGKANYVGTLEESPFSEATLHPTYGECILKDTMWAGAEVKVRTKGCDLTLTEQIEDEHHSVDIACEKGKVIELEVPTLKCKLGIGAQTSETGLKGGMVYVNTEATEEKAADIDATATLSELAYTRESLGVLCGALFTESGSGEAVSEITIRAYENLKSAGNLTQESFDANEGAQVDLAYDEGSAP